MSSGVDSSINKVDVILLQQTLGKFFICVAVIRIQMERCNIQRLCKQAIL